MEDELTLAALGMAGRGFNPAGVVFPVSSAILENIDSHRTVLEDYSKRLLPVIEWDATPEGNVEVRSDTGLAGRPPPWDRGVNSRFQV